MLEFELYKSSTLETLIALIGYFKRLAITQATPGKPQKI
jgi:hypothetical protein